MWVQSLGQEDPLEEDMATHSSIIAWKIPWTEEPGGLQSMGLQRVGHDWSNSAAACLFSYGLPGSDGKVCLQYGRSGFDPWVGKIPWRRKWQPTPVFLTGKSHGQRRLAGYYCSCGRKESDTTEWLHFLSFTFPSFSFSISCFFLFFFPSLLSAQGSCRFFSLFSLIFFTKNLLYI